MDYILDKRRYGISYQELKAKYHELVGLSDEDFLKRLPEVIHFACIMCWFKEIPGYVCLGDTGIVHEIAHLLHIPQGNTSTLQEIRELFNEQLKLV